MITKLDNPAKAESKDYTNRGGAGRLLNYLSGNADKIDENDMFFNEINDNISKENMAQIIDSNVKGLTQKDHKFFSISINPSHDELAWIKNDKQNLKTYVREVMKNYATSFKQNIDSNDLVWGAIIHEKRFVTDKEAYVAQKKEPGKEGLKAGEAKKGNQMHVHIIVSARDKKLEKTLNALTATNKISRNFELKGFQKRNQDTFQNMFYYKNGVNIYLETQLKITDKKLKQLDNLGFQPQDLDKIKTVGEKMSFNASFTRNLNRLVQECYKGNVIFDSEKYLEFGDKKYREQYPNGVGEGAFKLPEQKYVSQSEGWNNLDLAILELQKATSSQHIGFSNEKLNKLKKRKRRNL